MNSASAQISAFLLYMSILLFFSYGSECNWEWSVIWPTLGFLDCFLFIVLNLRFLLLWVEVFLFITRKLWIGSTKMSWIKWMKWQVSSGIYLYWPIITKWSRFPKVTLPHFAIGNFNFFLNGIRKYLSKSYCTNSI